MKKYSVLLLYPDPTDLATYFNHTIARSPEDAVTSVRLMANAANEGTIEPDDFELLAVFNGWIEMEMSSYDENGR